MSRASGPGGAGAAAASSVPAISADGRHVAFQSDADNLSAEDADGVADVFVRNLRASTTTLVSRAGGAGGAGAAAASSAPAISDDGRHVAFHSDADNLSPEDADGVADIFVRDLRAGTTTLVSRAAGAGGAGGGDDSYGPTISADGRYVAFVSDADNLSAEDLNAFFNVFRRDVLGPPPAPAQPPSAGTAPPIASVRCAGRRATIVGTTRRDVLRGTPRPDVIVALGGNDVVLRGSGTRPRLRGHRTRPPARAEGRRPPARRERRRPPGGRGRQGPPAGRPRP